MKKGDRIRVRTYSAGEVERVVLELHRTYVLACRPEVYAEVKDEDFPARSMGFPLTDVVAIYEKHDEIPPTADDGISNA